MGIDVGGCCLRDLALRPGNPTIKPLARAVCNVLSTGENSAEWANATNSVLVLAPNVALATWVGVEVSFDLVSTYQRPSRGLRGPVNTIVSLSVISILFLSKRTL